MVKPISPNGPAVVAVYLIAFLQGLTLVSFPASSAVLKQMHGFTDAQYGAIFLPQVALAVLGAVAGGTLARRLGLQTLLWLAAAGNGLSQLALAASIWVMPGAGVPDHSGGHGVAGAEFRAGRRTAEQLPSPLLSPARVDRRGCPAHPAGTRLDGGTLAGGRLRPGGSVDRVPVAIARSRAGCWRCSPRPSGCRETPAGRWSVAPRRTHRWLPARSGSSPPSRCCTPSPRGRSATGR